MSRQSHLHTVFASPSSWVRLWSLPSRHILEMFQRPSLVALTSKQSSVLVIYAFRLVLLVTAHKFGKTYECGKPDGDPPGSSPHSTKLPRTRLSHVHQHQSKLYHRHHLLLQHPGPMSEVKKCPGRRTQPPRTGYARYRSQTPSRNRHRQ